MCTPVFNDPTINTDTSYNARAEFNADSKLGFSISASSVRILYSTSRFTRLYCSSLSSLRLSSLVGTLNRGSLPIVAHTYKEQYFKTIMIKYV